MAVATARADWWRSLFPWWKDDDPSRPSFSRAPTPFVSSPFNVRRVSYLDLNLNWHGEGADLPAMLELVGRPIGRGGFSDVYKARHRETGGMFACKVFRHIRYGAAAEEGGMAVLSSLIQREMDVLRTLRHDHIVSYFGCLASPESHHLALLMELCDGGSVKDLLAQSSEKLRERHIAFILRCTLLALHYLHGQGLVHRDLKGANIFLTTHCGVRLGDFGISACAKRYAAQLGLPVDAPPTSGSSMFAPSSAASSAGGSGVSGSPGGSPDVDALSTSSRTFSFSNSDGSPLFNSATPSSSSSPHQSLPLSQCASQPMGGTPLWMSPECLEGAEPDFSGDVWSLGITAIEMAQGHPPHTRLTQLDEIRATVLSSPSPSLAAHAPSYAASAEFAAFVDACLVKDPRHRATVVDLLSHPFIAQARDGVVAPAPATHLPPQRSTHLNIPPSPRGGVSPASPGFSVEVGGDVPPPPMLLPRRSVSCPAPHSPFTPLSPRPSSHSPHVDADFRHFIIFGCYPADEDDAAADIARFDDAVTGPSTQRRFSTPSPVPPSPGQSPFSSLIDKLSKNAPRRSSIGAGGSAQHPSVIPPSLTLRGSRQLSVPSPRHMPSAMPTPNSLSPTAYRSPQKTPVASPTNTTTPTSSSSFSAFVQQRDDEHVPPVLFLPSLPVRSRKFQQGEDKAGHGRIRSEQKEATPSPSADSDDGDATPATPFRLVLNDEQAVHPIALRRAQTFDYAQSRDVQAVARSLQPLHLAGGTRRSFRRANSLSADLPVVSLDITPRAVLDEKNDEDDLALVEEEDDTPTRRDPSPVSSPSPVRPLPDRRLSLNLRPTGVFDFAHAAEQHSANAGGEEDDDDADAEVVDDLDSAFADLTKDQEHRSVSEPKPEVRPKPEDPQPSALKAGRRVPPPLITLSSITSNSGNSVRQLYQHIDLTPSPSPRPSDKDEAPSTRAKATALPVHRREESQPTLHAPLTLRSPSPLHTAASSPQLLAELLSSEQRGLSDGQRVDPHPTPAPSTVNSPASSSPQMASTSVASRRPTLSLLRLPGIVDDEPRSRSPSAVTPSASRAAPLSARASVSRPFLQLQSTVDDVPPPPEDSHDSYIISDHGTLITSEFRISAAGVITSPDPAALAAAADDGRLTAGRPASSYEQTTPRQASPSGSPSLPLTPRRLESGLRMPSHSRSFSTPMARMPLDELRMLSPLAASPPSASSHLVPQATADSASPRRPGPLRRLSSNDLTSPLRACLRAEDLVEMGDIGSGQHGSVLKALHVPSLTLVALKTMSVYDRDARHQLLKELRTFSMQHSEHLVAFLGAYHRDGQIIMGSEYMDCGSLLVFVQRNAAPLHPLPSSPRSPPSTLIGLTPALLRHFARQLVLGLEYLHRANLVHRDMKPDNVLIDHRYTARIGDFGLTTKLEHSKASLRSFTGTLAYLSPERASNQQHAFPADIWSLGMTLAYAAATARGAEHGGVDLFTIHSRKSEVEAVKAAASEDDDCHATFPRMPSLRTALIPKEIDARYHDEQLTSFLAACLQIAPEQRWTATQLLQHPFIALAHGGVDGMGLPAGFDAASERDLDVVCGILCGEYGGCGAEHGEGEECGSDCLLQLDEERVQRLAQQFGKTSEQVQHAFTRARKAQRARERRENERRQSLM